MARAMWRGNISFGLVSIPVSLYPAEETTRLSFHLLDKRDMAPVKNKRVNEATGEEVPWDDVVKGYEYQEGRWVTITEEDFRAANVEATQTIDILAAVCAEDIPMEYLDKPYFLEPMKPGRKAYALLREALRQQGRVAVGQVVIRTRQHLVAVVPHGRMLMLEQLRWPYELRDAGQLDLPSEDLKEAGVTDAELKMAAQLVSAMESEWKPEEFKDTYHEDLLRMIGEKAETGKVSAPPAAEFEPSAEVVDIMALLKRSVEAAGKTEAQPVGAAAGGDGHGAKKAPAKKRKAG